MDDNSMESTVSNLFLEIDVGREADADELQRLTHQLRSEIRELKVESVALVDKEDGPDGAKSVAGLTIGSLAVSILPKLIPALIGFLQSWMMRAENRKIKIKAQVGDRLVESEFSPENTSREDLRRFADMLMGVTDSRGKENREIPGIKEKKQASVHPAAASESENTLPTSQKFALIIGNNQYEDSTLSELATPEADVNALVELLSDPEIGGFDEVLPVHNQPVLQIRREIGRFFMKKKRDDLLLLYFSGHGVLDEQGELFLAVKDTERELLRATALSASFITGEMDRSNSQRQVFILDCCHSGAFGRGAKGASGASVGTATVFEGNGYGRVVLTATDSTQYAWEGDEFVGEPEHSVFTHYLIRGLQTGEADSDSDGRITLNDLYDYVYERVVSETPRQTPGKWSYKQQGEIVIARNPNPVIKPTELPQQLKEAIESPFAGVREGSVRELASMLHGGDKGLARAAYMALEEMRDDDSRRVSAVVAECLATYKQKGSKHGEPDVREKDRLFTDKPGKRQSPAETTKPTSHVSENSEIQEKAGTRKKTKIIQSASAYQKSKLLSLVLIILGWSIAGAIRIYSVHYSGFQISYSYLVYLFIGAIFTGAALWMMESSMRKKQILIICVGWPVIIFFAYNILLLGLIIPINGVIGGLIIGMVLKRFEPAVWWREVCIITLGWGSGFFLKDMLYLNGFYSSMIDSAKIITEVFLCAISGIIGGVVLLWQIGRIAKRKKRCLN